MDSKPGIDCFHGTCQNFIASTDLDVGQLQITILEEADETILPVRLEIFGLSIVQLLGSLLIRQRFIVATRKCKSFTKVKGSHTGKLSAANAVPRSDEEVQ